MFPQSENIIESFLTRKEGKPANVLQAHPTCPEHTEHNISFSNCDTRNSTADTVCTRALTRQQYTKVHSCQTTKPYSWNWAHAWRSSCPWTREQNVIKGRKERGKTLPTIGRHKSNPRFAITANHDQKEPYWCNPHWLCTNQIVLSINIEWPIFLEP